MMAGNPNWWSMINGMHPQPPPVTSQFIHGGNPNFSTIPPNQSSMDHFPVRSWSQLLLGGLGEERFVGNSNQFQNQHKKLDNNWEEDQQALIDLNPSFPRVPALVDHNHHHHHHHHHQQHVKQEYPQFYETNNQLLLQPNPVSSPANSCTTTAFSNSFLNFSGSSGKAVVPPQPQGRKHHQQNQDHSSEKGNSASSEGVQPKKARVQQSSAQPALKVRKEKLGDRITALHQLVSPFGKTDTASVLSEAIGYIRFLQAQIEALSSPYMRNRTPPSTAAGNNCTLHLQHSHSALADSEGPGVLQDLRSRGLCLVPTSFSQNVADADGSCCGGADYWAPATYGGGSAF